MMGVIFCNNGLMRPHAHLLLGVALGLIAEGSMTPDVVNAASVQTLSVLVILRSPFVALP